MDRTVFLFCSPVSFETKRLKIDTAIPAFSRIRVPIDTHRRPRQPMIICIVPFARIIIKYESTAKNGAENRISKKNFSKASALKISQ